jgi:hypothetical protein
MAQHLDQLVATAVHAVARGDGDTPAIDALAAHGDRAGGTGEVSAVLADHLVRAVGRLWDSGWQPADLAHVVGRSLKAGHRQVCADAIALDAHGYVYSPGADPAWLAQVEAVTARRPAADRTSLLAGWRTAAGDLRGAVTLAVTTLGWLRIQAPQPRLCVPPSEWGDTPPPRDEAGHGQGAAGAARRPQGADPKITERVRALLAKAESTTFPDEAEAFTAKAQELIARHAIDLAMLGRDRNDRSPAGDAVGRRVLIDDPYGKAKSMLLGAIAAANGCKTVWSSGMGIATVFGAPNDIDAVELLFASLLTQATAAMVAATPEPAGNPASSTPGGPLLGRLGRRGRRTGRGGGGGRGGNGNGNGGQARSFRQSFLVAYAIRIGERLQEAAGAAADDARAEHGDNVLPVLAARDAAAEEACALTFPRLRTQRIATSNAEGWVAGRAAADRARLGPDTALRAG